MWTSGLLKALPPLVSLTCSKVENLSALENREKQEGARHRCKCRMKRKAQEGLVTHLKNVLKMQKSNEMHGQEKSLQGVLQPVAPLGDSS